MKSKFMIFLLIGIVLIGTSYALWIQNLYQEDENTIATSCFSVSLEQANTISLKNAYPIYDEDGKKLTPYTFTIKNNCEAYATYQVNLEVLNSSTLTNPKFIKIMLDAHAPVILSSKEETQTTIEEATTAYKLATDGLDVNESKTYELRLWIDENVTLEDNIENSKFVAQIGITAAYSEKEITAYDLCIQKYGENSVQCSILADVDTTGSCPIMNSDGILSVSSQEKSKSLLCGAKDDYGDSYYFRGVPENNWVKFGGYYWRIIRINGDDSVRMIYAGDASVIDALDEATKATVLSNGYDDSTTQYTQIGSKTFNEYWKKDNVQEIVNSNIYNDNAGVGYMYGNRDGIVEGTTLYNTTSWPSTDTYYVSLEYNYDTTTDTFTLKNPISVLASNMLSDYIGYYTMSSTNSMTSGKLLRKIFSVNVEESSTVVGYSYVTYGTTSKEKAQTNTNDSDIKAYLDNWYATNLASYSEYISDTLFCNDRSVQTSIPNGYSNLGYGVEKTAYRWVASSNGIRLLCSQKNDRFTVSDEIVGNGDLMYSIGLIVSDEAYLAGGSTTNANISYYLYTGNAYWTMSPTDFHGFSSQVRRVNSNGSASSADAVRYSNGIRPVINLKPNVLNFGDGSASNPYMIVE